SRLGCGLVAQIRPPDPETRVSILRCKAQQKDVPIDNAIFEYIAQRQCSSVRDLEGSLNRLVAYAKMTRGTLTLELAKQAFEAIQENHALPPSPEAVTPLSIIGAVADHFNVPLESMQGKKRESRLTLARQIAIYLIREKTNYPLADIGRLLGGRDHSTVLRGYQRAATLVATDPSVQRNIDQICTHLPL
ncbi:MAG: DnaA/Hda family protein, partial [Chloroflexi bacterium]|nr:DnaA/Hda family protein [Chloroflexota bacterium]